MPHCGIFCLILHQARPRTAVTAVPFADGKSYSAHTHSIVRNADKILVVDNAKIAEEGTHGELLAQNADMQICGRQSKSL